jgi:hypothetical protein
MTTPPPDPIDMGTAALEGEGQLSAIIDVVQNHAVAFGGEGTLKAQMYPVQPAQSYMDQRLLHAQRCGCNMPVVPQSPDDQKKPEGRLGWLPGFPMDQPSGYQNRTTKATPRQRHPVNMNKPMDIITWQEQNPDNWPDGNPTPTGLQRLRDEELAKKPIDDLIERVKPNGS